MLCFYNIISEDSRRDCKPFRFSDLYIGRLRNSNQYGFLTHLDSCTSRNHSVRDEMQICYVLSLFWCIMRMLLLVLCLILFVTPPLFSSFQLPNRWHPHLSNDSDQEALLGFMSAITAYSHPSQSLPTTWKPTHYLG